MQLPQGDEPMTDTKDRRTKAQLLATEQELRDELKAARAAAYETKTEAPKRVPVADAIAACVRALDQLRPNDGGFNSYNRKSDNEIPHVIGLLCERYGVQRIERVTEPCTRRHIEDLTPADVVEALRRDMAMSEGPF
jgi:hypothetical protein